MFSHAQHSEFESKIKQIDKDNYYMNIYKCIKDDEVDKFVKIFKIFDYKFLPMIRLINNKIHYCNEQLMNFFIFLKEKIPNLEEYIPLDTKEIAKNILSPMNPGSTTQDAIQKIMTYLLTNVKIDKLIEKMNEIDELSVFKKIKHDYKLNENFVLFRDVDTYKFKVTDFERSEKRIKSWKEYMYEPYKNNIFNKKFRDTFTLILIENILINSILNPHPIHAYLNTSIKRFKKEETWERGDIFIHDTNGKKLIVAQSDFTPIIFANYVKIYNKFNGKITYEQLIYEQFKNDTIYFQRDHGSLNSLTSISTELLEMYISNYRSLFLVIIILLFVLAYCIYYMYQHSKPNSMYDE